jgi:hypothetical protein
VSEGALELPEEYGRFPFVEVESNPSGSVQIVSVLHAVKAGAAGPPASVRISEAEEGWKIRLPHTTIAIGKEEDIPTFSQT